MHPITPRYTFTLKICDSLGALVDMTIGAAQTTDGLAKAKETIHKALEEFTPMPIGIKVLKAPNTTAEPVENVPAQAPEVRPPAGAKGLLRLRCLDCGNIFGTFLREPQTGIDCRCGCHIDLTAPLARYRFSCRYCEKEGWGYTNLEDPEITVRCKCGGEAELRWNAKAKEYQN